VTATYVALATVTLLLLAAVATVLGAAAGAYTNHRRERAFHRFLVEVGHQLRQEALESPRPDLEQGFDDEERRHELREQRSRVLHALMGSAGEGGPNST
jgi:hypothetical protein